VVEVYDKVSEAVEYARKNGPVLIESLTYRYKGHGVSDRSYDKRLADELKDWMDNKDPVKILRELILSKYKSAGSKLEKIEEQAQKDVVEAVEFALNSPDPTYDDLISNIYVGANNG
jgi:pyruvate dehydrogenase E1 component alpha subunit